MVGPGRVRLDGSIAAEDDMKGPPNVYNDSLVPGGNHNRYGSVSLTPNPLQQSMQGKSDSALARSASRDARNQSVI